MGRWDSVRAFLGMSPREATFSDESAPRPVAQVISEMMQASGRISRDEALSVAAVKRGRDIICGLANWPLETIDVDNRVIRTPLLNQINPNVPDVVTIAQTLDDLLFHGVSWWEITDFGSDGYPLAARHLDVSQVTVDSPAGSTPAPLPSGLDPRGEIRVDGRPVSIERIIKFDSPNPPLLVVGGRAIRRALALDKAAETYANDPRPMDFFTPADPTVDPASDEDIDEALSQWARWRRKRATGYVPAALKYNTVQQPTPADLQLVGLQQRAALDIANHIGLDPEDLGVSTTSRTYANAVDRRQDRINDVLAAYASALTSRLSMGDITKRGQRVRIQLDSYLRADPKTRVEVQQARLTMGTTTVEEIRKDEGEPPLPASAQRPAPAVAAPLRVPSVTGEPRPALTATAELSADEAVTFESDAVTEAFSVDEQRRTITGLAIPWGEQAYKGGRHYRFARGGQRFSKLDRVKFLEDHDWAKSFGRAVKIEDTDAGLLTTFKVARGEHGDRMLSLAADGAKDGLSVGVAWEPADEVPDPLNSGGWLVKQYRLRETSLLANPAFDSSRLTSVTASDDGKDAGMPDTETVPATPAPVVTFNSEQFSQLLGRMGNPQQGPEGGTPAYANATDGGRQVVNPLGNSVALVSEPTPYRFDARGNIQRGSHDFSTDLIAGSKGDATALERAQTFVAEHYANFDVDRADVGALNPNRNRPDLYVDQRGYRYPVWNAVNKGTLADSTPFVLPKFSSASGLVATHTEGTEPTPGSYVATSQTITPTAVSGKVEITREAWDQGGNPQLSGIIWRKMERAYFEALEARIVAVLDAASPTALATFTTGGGTDGQTLVAELTAGLAGLQFVRGGFSMDNAFLQVDLYKALIAAKDGNGRPLYPALGPSNTNGTVGNRFGSIEIAPGVVGFPAWALAASGTVAASSYLFDSESVHGWATPPQRLEFQYRVAYVDLAVWGYGAAAITDTNGVREISYDPAA